MRIALLSYDFPEYCIQQCNGLVRHGDVLLMLPESDAREYAPALDPAVRFLPFAKRRLRQPLRQLVEVGRLVRQIREFRPDVVHFHHGHMWFNLALPLLRNYPLVTTLHDPQRHTGDGASQKTPQWLMNFGYRRADRLIVHGEEMKRQAVTSLGAPAGRVHSVPHIAIGQKSERKSDSPEKNMVLFFGRIWEYKGLDYLIQAEPLISREIPDVKFVIAGEGEDFARYRNMMEHPERFVVYNRYVSAAERDELFQQSAVVALPYIDATQSGVIPVAYSFEKPVVATRVGALAEAVDDGVTGRLIPPRDVHALAAAVVELLRDPVQRQCMGAAGRRKLDAESSPIVIANQTVDIYRRAIDDRAHGRRTRRWMSRSGSPCARK